MNQEMVRGGMDYQKAIDYLESTIHLGINPGLQRIKALCKELGDPHFSYPTIHITGTNGKTSVTKMIASILSAHGLKTGAYISPHLSSYTERISVDGRNIAEEEFASVLTDIAGTIEKVNLKFHPERLTHFEILTALAFFYFHHENIDCGVIEVGMGGRWDATNIIPSKVAVLISVALEHTDRLGTSIHQIATEKAQIIKDQCKAVVGSLPQDAFQVVEKKCIEQGANMRVLGRDFSLLSRELLVDAQKLSIQGLYDNYTDLNLPLFGKHQAQNGAIAMVATESFYEKPLSLSKLKKGFSKVDCPGRLEIMAKHPFVVLDGAHNPAAAIELARSLQSEFAFERLILVLAILKDKDIDGILKGLVDMASFVILSQNQSSRCAPAQLLEEKISNYSSCFIRQPNLGDAIELALKMAKPQDLICITGSLYTVGEAREHLLQRQEIIQSM